MGSDRVVEKYVPNRRFDESLDAEGLAKVISSEIDGCSMLFCTEGWTGGVDMGSGDIGIDVYGKSFKDIRVEISYDESVVNRHKREVRGVFGNIGLRKE